MKGVKLRKYFLVAISMCVLMCMISITALAGETDVGYGYSQLKNVVQQELYIGIRDGIAELKNPISLTLSDSNITGDDLQLAAEMVVADHPEYFWFNCGLSASIYSSGRVELTATYMISGQTVTSADGEYAALMDVVEDILDDMPNDADTDYEKALYLHDALAQRVTYVSTNNDQTAYGALVEGEAVCAGYASAYQLLLEAAGVDAWTVVGDSLDPGTGAQIAHAWNLMWLDGACYYADVTWDDQGQTLFHEYFSCSLAEFSATHLPNDIYAPALPSCGHDAYDYFVLEATEGSGIGGVVDDSTAVSDIFDYTCVLQKDGYTNATISVYYTGSDFSSWMNSYIQYAGNALGLNGYTCSYRTLTNEWQITIISGVGGVYTAADEDTIYLKLSYRDIGLTQGSTYDLMVAYYSEDGQFIEAVTAQATVGSYGSVSLYADCPNEFDTCKVFVPAAGTYVPLCKAITVMEK